MSHELIVVLSRGELIAVRAERSVLDRLQKQLNTAPLPPLRRLGSGVLEEAFVQGAAKNIWMRSIQRRSALMPTSKAIGGDDLGVALDPVEDGFFAWDAARCEMPDVDYCSEGWLICDDSSGEAADFFHIDDEYLLRVFHVKASSNKSGNRGVKVGDYDVVLAQAQKNMLYLDKDLLADRLGSSTLEEPACWFDGERVQDRRQGFLAKLKGSRSKGTTEVVVVQPNLSRKLYDKVSEDIANGVVNQNTLRLQLLEMQLKMARIAAVKYVTDLTVIGSG